MMPAMAAAYATLKRNQVPRATPALNVLQRVGGSIGAALLIVILQNRIISSLGEGAQGGVSGGALSDAARTAWPIPSPRPSRTRSGTPSPSLRRR